MKSLAATPSPSGMLCPMTVFPQAHLLRRPATASFEGSRPVALWNVPPCEFHWCFLMTGFGFCGFGQGHHRSDAVFFSVTVSQASWPSEGSLLTTSCPEPPLCTPLARFPPAFSKTHLSLHQPVKLSGCVPQAGEMGPL